MITKDIKLNEDDTKVNSADISLWTKVIVEAIAKKVTPNKNNKPKFTRASFSLNPTSE